MLFPKDGHVALPELKGQEPNRCIFICFYSHVIHVDVNNRAPFMGQGVRCGRVPLSFSGRTLLVEVCERQPVLTKLIKFRIIQKDSYPAKATWTHFLKSYSEAGNYQARFAIIMDMGGALPRINSIKVSHLSCSQGSDVTFMSHLVVGCV